jgi:uncharacterized protein (DUF302 family)
MFLSPLSGESGGRRKGFRRPALRLHLEEKKGEVLMHALRKTLRVGYDEALRAIPEALKSEGFGVLTEIDIRDTLKKKLGVDLRPYKILGACNPALAHRALQTELDVGTMLPCNVAVYEDDERRVVVAMIDPAATLAAGNQALRPIADEVREKLLRVLERLE